MKCETAALQDIRELTAFIDILKRENVRSYLEIGSKFGGSLWRVASGLQLASKMVAVDLPHGDKSFKESLPPLQECINEMRKRFNHQTSLIIGDSTDEEVIEDVRKLGPFDACLIDANHTEPYVRKDWANYGPMCRIVAFHDIGWVPRPEPTKKMPIEVPKVWNEIKKQYRHQEIRLNVRDNGIGVLWRH